MVAGSEEATEIKGSGYRPPRATRHHRFSLTTATIATHSTTMSYMTSFSIQIRKVVNYCHFPLDQALSYIKRKKRWCLL